MRSGASFAAVLLALCVCFFCPRVGAEESADNTRYAALLKQGVDAFTQGEWQAARAAFERAHAIEPTARTYRGLALCDFELGNYAHSVRELEAALNDPRRPLTAELRVQVLRTLERAMRDAGRVHLMLPEGVSELRVDGHVEHLPEGGVVLLDPGSHTLLVSIDGRERITRQIEIDNGESQNLIIAALPLRHAELQPLGVGATAAAAQQQPVQVLQPMAAASSGPRIWSWVGLGLTAAAGAGAAGLAVATGEKHAAFSAQQQAYAARLAAGDGGTPPSEQHKRSGQRLELLTNLSLAACGVLGAATVALFILERPGAEQPVQVRAALHPSGIALQGQF
jgi:tetratricopeptide (TPR) repeat protein